MPRAREFGVPFDGTPGALNAVTDVAGVEVGHATVRSEEGRQPVVRTGVTALLPRGRAGVGDPVYAGVFSLNGNGEMTGTHWIEESGFLEGPVLLTNTHSVGVVRDAAVAWMLERRTAPAGEDWWSLPVVAETWDGWLSDIDGFHVRAEHAIAALEAARGGAVGEGSVGGGTGMIGFEFKGGIGTSSRVVRSAGSSCVVGALAQVNFGLRDQLLIAGVPVGREIPLESPRRREAGSIIALLATDAPLLPHQCRRLARRAALGIARTGSIAANSSGDLFLAFSTGSPGVWAARETYRAEAIPNAAMTPLFAAAVEATEEAVINALFAGKTTTGPQDRVVPGLPHERVRELLRRFGRIPAG
jgi:L-aminopeptidase/D-esterase-like protein